MLLGKCNLCGSNIFQLLLESKDFGSESGKSYKLYRCKICNLCQQNPIPSAQQIQEFYPKNYPGNYVEELSTNSRNTNITSFVTETLYKINRTLFLSFKRDIKKIIDYKNNNNLQNLDILDVGCGSGLFLIALKKYNFNLMGIDIDEDVVNSLSKSYQLNVEVSSFDDFKTERKFDVIFMSHYLEHDPDPMKTLIKAKDLLKKGGMLIIKVPNIDCLTFKIFGKYTYLIDIPRHIFMFNSKTLRNYVDTVGFQETFIVTNTQNLFFQSLLNFLDLGKIRTMVYKSFWYRLIYYIFSSTFSAVLKIIFFPLSLFFEGEEIVLCTRAK